MKPGFAQSLILVSLFARAVYAGDMGFRYRDGKCVNKQGIEGLNTSYYGQCSDLRAAAFGRVGFDGLDLSGSRFDGADIQKSTFRQTKLIGVRFDAATFSGVEFSDLVIRQTSFSNATLRNVQFSEVKIFDSDFSGVDFGGMDLSFLHAERSLFKAANFGLGNLPQAVFLASDLTEAKFYGATLDGSAFDGSVLDGANFQRISGKSASFKNVMANKAKWSNAVLNSADFRNATVVDSSFKRAKLNFANFQGASVETCDLHRADFTQSNVEVARSLSGSRFNDATSFPFTRAKALELKLAFVKTSQKAFVLWDRMSADLTSQLDILSKFRGIEIVLSKSRPNLFDGTEPLEDFDTVIHFNGSTESTDSTDMPEAGQKAILRFVERGGRYISSGWNTVDMGRGKLQFLKPLSLYKSAAGRSALVTLEVKADDSLLNHPIFEGVTMPFRVQASHTRTAVIKDNLASILKFQGNDILALGRYGAGTIVDFEFNCGFQNAVSCFTNANVILLFANAAEVD